MRQEEIPAEVLERAVRLSDEVSFLTHEEKELYAGGLVGAMLWAKSVEEQKNG